MSRDARSSFLLGSSPWQVGRFRPFPAKRWFFLFSLLLMMQGTVTPAFAAGKERIRNVTAEVVNGEIVVSAELISGFGGEIEKDIQNGIPKDFYYYILLKRKEKNWFDEEVLSKTVRYTVKYDTLKKQYRIVYREGDEVTESTSEDFETMKRRVSQVSRVKLAPIQSLKSRYRYYASVKSQMRAAKLPFYLDYFLFFIPFLELDTPWSDSGTISLPRGG